MRSVDTREIDKKRESDSEMKRMQKITITITIRGVKTRMRIILRSIITIIIMIILIRLFFLSTPCVNDIKKKNNDKNINDEYDKNNKNNKKE